MPRKGAAGGSASPGAGLEATRESQVPLVVFRSGSRRFPCSPGSSSIHLLLGLEAPRLPGGRGQ